MTIAITAATGKVGTALRSQFAAAGQSVRALARRGDVPFDFTDPSTYARALDGVRTLVLISPPQRDQDARDVAFVDAAKRAGVTHVVKLSGYRADDTQTRFAAQHRTVEAHVRASRLGFTFVRPTFFMENFFGLAAPIGAGTYPAPLANARMTHVAVADVAAVLLAAALAPAEHHDAIYAPTGPTVDSGEDIARALTEATGRAVRYVDLPESALRETMLAAGHDAWGVEGILEAFANVRAGNVAAVTGDVERATKRAPIAFSAWARENATRLGGSSEH